MHYLITLHSTPKFYTFDCKVVTPDLEYISKLEKTYIVDDKILFSGNEVNSYIDIDGDWMVKCPREAIALLRSLNVHPFRTKKDAKNFAVKKKLRSFRYLSIK